MRTISVMGLRPEEKRAGELFERWLSEHKMPGTRVTWEPVERDPPDFCFTVGREGACAERWAVEVTTLVQYVEFNGEERNTKDFFALLDRMCDRLNRELPEQASRGYLVWGSGPFESTLLRAVEERARAYIENGKTQPEHLDLEEAKAEVRAFLNSDPTDPHVRRLIEEEAVGRAKFSIQPAPGEGKVVWTGWLHASARTPGGKNFVGEIQATLRYALQRILDAKLPSLRSLTGYDRKMLVILSDYFWAEPGRLREILYEKKLTAEDVDTIFLIDGDSAVSIIDDPSSVFCSRPGT